jgi:hypothetical protein
MRKQEIVEAHPKKREEENFIKFVEQKKPVALYHDGTV